MPTLASIEVRHSLCIELLAGCNEAIQVDTSATSHWPETAVTGWVTQILCFVCRGDEHALTRDTRRGPSVGSPEYIGRPADKCLHGFQIRETYGGELGDFDNPTPGELQRRIFAANVRHVVREPFRTDRQGARAAALSDTLCALENEYVVCLAARLQRPRDRGNQETCRDSVEVAAIALC